MWNKDPSCETNRDENMKQMMKQWIILVVVDEKVSAHSPEGDDVKEADHPKGNKRGPASWSVAGGRSWANIVAGDDSGCY